jgi:hypothetical protein
VLEEKKRGKYEFARGSEKRQKNKKIKGLGDSPYKLTWAKERNMGQRKKEK